MKTEEIAALIYERLFEEKESLAKAYNTSKNKIGHFYIDDLLPETLVKKITSVFPPKEEMILKKSSQ